MHRFYRRHKTFRKMVDSEEFRCPKFVIETFKNGVLHFNPVYYASWYRSNQVRMDRFLEIPRQGPNFIRERNGSKNGR